MVIWVQKQTNKQQQKNQSLPASSVQGPRMQTALHRNVSVLTCLHLHHWTACLHCASALWAGLYTGVPRALSQPRGRRLSSSNPSCAAPAHQRDSILTNQESGTGTYVYINQMPSGLESALSTKDWTYVFPAGAHTRWLPGAEWSGVHQGKHGAERTVVGRSFLAEEGLPSGTPGPRAASGPYYFQSCTVALSSCPTAVLVLQPCCITVEPFALNKVSFFTAPQTGNSSWHRIGAKDYCRLTTCTHQYAYPENYRSSGPAFPLCSLVRHLEWHHYSHIKALFLWITGTQKCPSSPFLSFWVQEKAGP